MFCISRSGCCGWGYNVRPVYQLSIGSRNGIFTLMTNSIDNANNFSFEMQINFLHLVPYFCVNVVFVDMVLFDVACSLYYYLVN